MKRDDLLCVPDVGLSGNKARKFWGLWESEISSSSCDEIVSYGGSQSNAMVAIAAIAHAKNIRFVYYVKKLGRFLRERPEGNLLRAKALGMHIVEVENDEYERLFGGREGGRSAVPDVIKRKIEEEINNGVGDGVGNGDGVQHRCLWIPQGGAADMARGGVEILAEEIYGFCTQLENSDTSVGCDGSSNGEERKSPIAIIVPSGTGTTAYYLNCALQKLLKSDNCDPDDITVVAVPNVGDTGYLHRQMANLQKHDANEDVTSLPTILEPKMKLDGTRKKYINFGKPEPFILKMWLELQEEHDLYVDLLYGAPTFHMVMPYLTTEGESVFKGKRVMYYHSGGLEGVSSQLNRYKQRGLIDSALVQ